MKTKITALLFCLLALPAWGQQAQPLDSLPAVDEAVMADVMWELGTLPRAELFLQEMGYRLKFRNTGNGAVIYSCVGGGEGAVFHMKPMTPRDPQLRVISFSTTTHFERLADSLLGRGFEFVDHTKWRGNFRRGDLLVTLRIDEGTMFSTVTFIKEGNRFAF